MKSVKTIFSSIALIVMLLIGATSAHAQVQDVQDVNNGVTCLKRIGGAYPEDGHFYYCGNSLNNKISFLNAIKTTIKAYPNVSTQLINSGTSFFFFANPVDAAVWGTSVQNPPDSDKQKFYNSARFELGRSGGSVPNLTSIIYENEVGPNDVYPNYTSLSQGLVEHTILHEMGHDFDTALGTPSTQVAYSLVVQKDQLFLTGAVGATQAATLRSQNSYFIDPTNNAPPGVQWEELYAEEFANYVLINQTATGAVSISVDTSVITPYFKCSSLFVSTQITADRQPNASEYAASGCTPQCVVYPSPLGTTYPKTGHLYNCMGTPRNGTEQTYQTNIMSSLSSTITTFKGDLAKLSAKNVDFYVFYDPLDAYIVKGIAANPPSSQIALSYVDPPAGNPNLPNASSILYVYTQAEWQTIYPAVPNAPKSIPFTGSADHELGHQMDRIWAQGLSYAPAATALISLNSTNQAYYLSALAWDYAAMSSADKATLWSTYPYLMVNSTTINNYEMFAEQKANSPGVGRGGTTGKSFLGLKLPCAQWVVNQLSSNNGAFPAAPSSGQCHSHTTW